MRRRARLAVIIPIALVAVIGLFAVVGFIARDGGSGSRSGASSITLPAHADAGAPGPAMGSAAGAAGKSVAGGSASDQSVYAAVPPVAAPSAHFLVRTGDLALLVAKGTLLPTVDRIKAMTTAMGGYVMSSSLGSMPSGTPTIEPLPLGGAAQPASGAAPAGSAALSQPYATLVVRVPEQLFDAALKRFAKLGDVQSASTSSEDVTSQYVDLQARVRHYRAVERRLVGFLSQTTNVNQMLAVQDRIDRVQLTIDELTAQLKSLHETTTYGTLSVYLSEKDRTQPAAIHASDSFGGTFWNSILLLGHGARVTGLVLTALVPFVAVFGGIALVVFSVVRRSRRGRRQAAPPTLPA
jgi:hypothetical protein